MNKAACVPAIAALRTLGLASLLATLGACTVGPDFVRPAPPAVQRYTAAAMPATMGADTGAAQSLRVGAALSAQWWELFRSSKLDAVVSRAVADNKTLAAARAALAQAQATVAAARGAYFPQIAFDASASRRRSGTQLPGSGASASISNVYSLGPTVSYAPDVFGGARRVVEQQQALAQFQRYELAAAYLTLTGNAVSQAVSMASLRGQIEATEAVVTDDERNLTLVREKYTVGKAAWVDILTARTQLAADRAALPALRQQLSAAQHALSILAGSAPAGWSPPAFDLADFTLPHALPLTLPSELVRQRPDILAAEAQLHASSAAIGIATAQLYPSVTLSGSLGQQALSTAALFQPASRYWSLSGDLLAPIFQGGRLRAQRRAAIAAYRASLASYEQTVLQGLQQVADTLQALQHDAQLVEAERQILVNATDALQLQRISYAAGKTSLLTLIDAERSYQQARLGLVRAQAQRLQDTAQLFVALGGGWWQAGLDQPIEPLDPRSRGPEVDKRG